MPRSPASRPSAGLTVSTKRLPDLRVGPGITNAVAQALKSAAGLRASAITLAAEENFAESIDQSAASRQKLQSGFLPGTTARGRASFAPSGVTAPSGCKGLSWDEAIRRLATNGFTAIIPNMLWGGAAFYESKVLPVAAGGGRPRRPDRAMPRRLPQIRRASPCLEGELEPGPGRARRNLSSGCGGRAGCKPVRSGKEEPWLCPSHPENQKLEIDSMLEVARNYDVDGIHFDYIRYPDSDHCFCAGCRERFQRAAGATVQPTGPRTCWPEAPSRQHWLDWRRSNITAVVKAVSEQARAIKPKLKISAAVFRNWTADRDGVGQDWKLWCDKGYLDFVCPMDYTPSNTSFETWSARQVAVGGPKCPAIPASASAPPPPASAWTA